MKKTLMVMLFAISIGLASKTTQAADPLCPDAGLFGSGLITKICWDCLFPIKMMGFALGGDIPSGSVDESFCSCEGNGGIPQFGITMGAWFPARIIEVVRSPYCSPTFGGIRISDMGRLQGGSRPTKNDASDGAFYNYHYIAFPLYVVLELLTSDACNKDGFMDLDMLYLSEFDPTWNNDELAMLISPEAAVFASPVAVAACTVDCALATARTQVDANFWCAGCWGHLYPFSGHTSADNSPVGVTSLLATRSVARMHRLGMAMKTMGDNSLCTGTIAPMITRTQYKMSMIFPVAEAASGGRCCHGIGESTLTWGEWRTIPGVGEDYLYLLWRFQDCCLR